MLARMWDGATKAEDGDEYVEYLRRTGVADLAATEGNRGVFVLRREEREQTRFRLLSLWSSMEGVGRFAGGDAEKARYYPEDERFLVERPSGVEHYEVVIGSDGSVEGGEGPALAEELRVLWRGLEWQDDAWHGPALKDLLEGVSSDLAAARPIRGGHSIWELVLHMAAWADVWRRRLEGEALDEPEIGDFPEIGATTPEGWAEARLGFEAGQEAFAQRVARLTPDELGSTVPGRAYDARFMVRGAIRHTVHHGGQIALLKKQGVGTPMG